MSAQKALQNILPKIFGANITFDIHPYQGKLDLINKLPQRLKGYKAWLPPDYRIVVLVDEDREDCHKLKLKLEKIAIDAGFTTKSMAPDGSFQVLNRVAVEELEAWFFGDIPAIVKAYPKVSANLASKSSYRNPDAITGGTWEDLERVLQKAGYHQGGLEKNKAAREISQFMELESNCSPSFQAFYLGILTMVQVNT
ncbi:DUF4276 family protein [[Phormidium] sp. ETS-05]|uniref:DUF4276 family protein n=1 Tax=[Phormidium] sp. ETS-05 TaxID=222819 RepID=UPI0018EF1634|nr:DUF4276 family protein [[Phormidium] sp. ETS-05]